MTKLFSLQSKFFWPAIALCLLPFVLLVFLNSMAMDDYLFYDLYRTRGFFGAQHDLYLTWAGRYTSSFIICSLIGMDLPGRFPYLPTLLYLGFTWGSVCYFLRSVGPLLPAGFSGRNGCWKAGTVVFILLLYVQADIATGFFWFSSMVVYQTAFILFLLLIATIVRRVNAPKTVAPVEFLLYLLIFLLTGCNEIMAVFIPLFLAALAAAFYFYGRPVSQWLWLGLAIAIGMGMVIFFTSGVMTYRYHLMNTHTGFLAILPIIGFRTVTVFFYIFKEPLFWGCAVALFILGMAVSPQFSGKSRLAVFREKNIFLPGFSTLLLIVLLSLAAFLLASRGSIPPRVLNNLSDVTTCCILILSFLAGICKGQQFPSPVFPGFSPALPLALLISVMLASVTYVEAWKSVVSGYFYHAVVKDRDLRLKTAAREHRHTAVVPSYDVAWKAKIDQVFPHGVFETVHQVLLQKPTLLMYYDGAATGDAAYAHFYGLDSIIVQDK